MSGSAQPLGRPQVAAAGIAFDHQGRVLLIRRGKAPHAEVWSAPGGRVEAGERLTDACAREVQEETGLEVEVGPLVDLVEWIGEGFHYVIADYLVEVRGGALAPGDDAAEARWVDDDELARLPLTTGLADALAKARRSR